MISFRFKPDNLLILIWCVIYVLQAINWIDKVLELKKIKTICHWYSQETVYHLIASNNLTGVHTNYQRTIYFVCNIKSWLHRLFHYFSISLKQEADQPNWEKKKKPSHEIFVWLGRDRWLISGKPHYYFVINASDLSTLN